MNKEMLKKWKAEAIVDMIAFMIIIVFMELMKITWLKTFLLASVKILATLVISLVLVTLVWNIVLALGKLYDKAVDYFYYK